MPVPVLNRTIRRQRRRAVALAAAVTLAVTIAVLATPNSGAATDEPDSATSARAVTLGFQVQLGPERRLIGPTGEIDVPYFSERDADNKLFGVAGTSRTKVWKAANNTRLSKPRLILDRGGAGKFDECGVWLMSIQKITAQKWIGFYHAENKGGADTCNHIADTTVWRMGLAETTNGGRTWDKSPGTISYPNNVILTGKNSTATTGTQHAGNGRVVKLKVGSSHYYYMFFQAAHGEHTANPGVYVARALVKSDGMPGVFKKWLCTDPPLGSPSCGWNGDGIGGDATPISGISEKARYISWNSYLKKWIGLDASGKIGFRLFATDEAPGTDEASAASVVMDWAGNTPIYAPVSSPTDPNVDQWGGSTRTSKSRQLYAYPSILGNTGDSVRSGKSFYIYYMKLFPGDKFDARHLFRRKVTLVRTSTPLNRVELTIYRDRKSGKRRASTEAPKAKSYRRIDAAGYLLSHTSTGFKQVYDCTRRGDYALHLGRCKTGWKQYRRVGWISTSKTGVASVPVFRCFDKSKRSHFVATKSGCGGAKKEARIGFALRSQ